MNVVCLGSKPCRKAKIAAGVETVTCTAGGSTKYQACEKGPQKLICQENSGIVTETGEKSQ